MASNKINGFGIGTDKVITIKKIFKGGEGNKKWAGINCSDSAKTQSGYKTLGYFCIWIQNKDVIDKINNGSEIKIKNISKVYFSESTYNGKTSTVLNINAEVELVNDNSNNNNSTNQQFYEGNQLTEDDLPNWL